MALNYIDENIYLESDNMGAKHLNDFYSLPVKCSFYNINKELELSYI